MKEQAQTNKIIIENETKHNFIIVYDTIYKNHKLSANEIKLIITLLGTAPSFKLSYDSLTTILNMSSKTLRKATKGLQDKGYLKIEKNGAKSKWTITQEPFNEITLNKYDNDTILKALLNYDINLKDLYNLHKCKLIDDNQLIKIKDSYINEINRIIKTEWIKK